MSRSISKLARSNAGNMSAVEAARAYGAGVTGARPYILGYATLAGAREARTVGAEAGPLNDPISNEIMRSFHTGIDDRNDKTVAGSAQFPHRPGFDDLQGINQNGLGDLIVIDA